MTLDLYAIREHGLMTNTKEKEDFTMKFLELVKKGSSILILIIITVTGLNTREIFLKENTTALAN